MQRKLFMIIAVLTAIWLGQTAWAADSAAPATGNAAVPAAPAPPAATPGKTAPPSSPATHPRPMPSPARTVIPPLTREEILSTPPTKAEIDTVIKDGRYLATIQLKDGKKITLVLEGKLMPYTVANFVKLVRIKFYDGVSFYDVMQSGQKGKGQEFKVLLTGDPNNDGSGDAGYTIPLEISPFLQMKRGVICMLHNTGAQSGSCQFFLTASEVKQVEGQFAVFGWVKDGLAELDKINRGDVITSITVTHYAGKEACPIYGLPTSKWKRPSKADIAATKTHGRYLATLTLNDNKQVEIVLEGSEDPSAVANFVKLAKAKFYDGSDLALMPSMMSMQMMQGGNAAGDGSEASYQIKIEKNRLVNPAGAIGMMPPSLRGPFVASSQFYVALSDLTQLNTVLSPFGWVKRGLDDLRALKGEGKITSIAITDYTGDDANPLIAKAPALKLPPPTPKNGPGPNPNAAPGTPPAPNAGTGTPAKPATTSTLIINDETVGTGAEAVAGKTVSMLYTGWLTDGTKFDSSADHGNQPLTFILGNGDMIKGWDQGLVGMKVGGKRKLTIPPESVTAPPVEGRSPPMPRWCLRWSWSR